jgi:AhpD family alkylhydroperoxidase
MRIDYKKWPEVYRPMRVLKEVEHGSALDPLLLELVRIRASQLNGCAHCIEMHVKDARALGETDLRTDLVSVWEETELYTERERAALRWTEELTLLPSRTVPDELYEATRATFSEEELVQLTMVIITINAWNRLAVSFRASVGDYVSRVKAATGAEHEQPATVGSASAGS